MAGGRPMVPPRVPGPTPCRLVGRNGLAWSGATEGPHPAVADDLLRVPDRYPVDRYPGYPVGRNRFDGIRAAEITTDVRSLAGQRHSRAALGRHASARLLCSGYGGSF